MCTFYLDENVSGRVFVEILRAAGINLVTCGELGLAGAPDELWIPKVTELQHVILSGDIRTRYIGAEKLALSASRARMIYIKQGNRTTHAQLADNFVNTHRQIQRFIRRHPAPWLVTLTRPPNVSSISDGKPGRLSQNHL